uniref:Uncharacterized protein n=1 Tax=Arundo donax TaxID=35708 RepID=A0A0A9CY57_ARUDO
MSYSLRRSGSAFCIFPLSLFTIHLAPSPMLVEIDYIDKYDNLIFNWSRPTGLLKSYQNISPSHSHTLSTYLQPPPS